MPGGKRGWRAANGPARSLERQISWPESLSSGSIYSLHSDDSSDSYQYTNIDSSLDSIRLLVVKPPIGRSSLIECRLETIPSAHKPKYEALSYTWGSEVEKYKIFVDGKPFQVSFNLFSALAFLRGLKDERTLWVDAICINQSNLVEKNSQISMMPWIYTRALQVLVWLGPHTLEGWNVFVDAAAESRKIMLKELCQRDYWKRVWIVQEICVARKISVCLGRTVIPWEALMSSLGEFPSLRKSLPYQIGEQLSRKYGDGHKLQNLIEAHKDKLCKEPRDHVYGFAGLAVDYHGDFPVDYQKSLYEVWQDIMAFKSKKDANNANILKFGQLVLDLFGGKSIATPEELAGDGLASVQMLSIPAFVAGQINHFGPSLHGILSRFECSMAWRTGLNRWLAPHLLPVAREESDLFLQVLEKMNDEHLSLVSNIDVTLLWGKNELSFELEGIEKHVARYGCDKDRTIEGEKHRLFTLGGYEGTEITLGPGMMGLAPSAARIGDFIFQIPGVKKSIIVRRIHPNNEDTLWKVVGTAGLAECRWDARKSQYSDKIGFAVFQDQPNSASRFFEVEVPMSFVYDLIE